MTVEYRGCHPEHVFTVEYSFEHRLTFFGRRSQSSLKKLDRGFRPGKGKRGKVSRKHFPRTTEAYVVDLAARYAPAAVRRTQVPRSIDPGTAPNQSVFSRC